MIYKIDFKIFEPTGERLTISLIISLSLGDASLDGHSDYYMIKVPNAYYWQTNWGDLDAGRIGFSIILYWATWLWIRCSCECCIYVHYMHMWEIKPNEVQVTLICSSFCFSKPKLTLSNAYPDFNRFWYNVRLAHMKFQLSFANRDANNIPTMLYFTGISRDTQSKSYMLSLNECVREFRNSSLWDTH